MSVKFGKYFWEQHTDPCWEDHRQEGRCREREVREGREGEKGLSNKFPVKHKSSHRKHINWENNIIIMWNSFQCICNCLGMGSQPKMSSRIPIGIWIIYIWNEPNISGLRSFIIPHGEPSWSVYKKTVPDIQYININILGQHSELSASWFLFICISTENVAKSSDKKSDFFLLQSVQF